MAAMGGGPGQGAQTDRQTDRSLPAGAGVLRCTKTPPSGCQSAPKPPQIPSTQGDGAPGEDDALPYQGTRFVGPQTLLLFACCSDAPWLGCILPPALSVHFPSPSFGFEANFQQKSP